MPQLLCRPQYCPAEQHVMGLKREDLKSQRELTSLNVFSHQEVPHRRGPVVWFWSDWKTGPVRGLACKLPREHIERRFSQGRTARSQHLFLLTRLAQLHLHKATHRGNFFYMPKMLFLSQEMCDGSAGARLIAFSTEATVGGLSGDACGLCHPGLFPERRDRKWPGILGGYKPSSVSLYQTTIRYFIQMGSEHGPL